MDLKGSFNEIVEAKHAPDDGFKKEEEEDEPTSTNTTNTNKGYVIPSFLDILLDSDFRIVSQEPPLQLDECEEDRQLLELLLAKYWDPVTSRQLLNQHDEDVGKEFTYGEITAIGVRQLMEDRKLALYNDNDGIDNNLLDNNEGVVFYDLGSGEGKCCCQILLECRLPIQSITGIELSPARHAMALQSWEHLKHDLEGNQLTLDAMDKEDDNIRPAQERLQRRFLQDDLSSKLQLVEGNLIECDFSNATHIYASSIFFPACVLETMCHKINRYSLDHGRIQVVAALSDLEFLENATDASGLGLWDKQTQRLQMSWGGAFVRIYRRKDY